MPRCLSISMAFVLTATLSACATKSQAPLDSARAAKPAYSLKATNDTMIVAMSPARQTLQLGGTAGLLIGSSISAISDARHRKIINGVLEGYDAGAIFDARLSERLEAAYEGQVERVSPLQSTAGYRDAREAEVDRIRGLRRAGYDQILDVKMTYGLYGFEGTLIAKLDGELLQLERGKKSWNDTILVSSAPILASDKLSDPTNRMGPTISSPRLSVDDDAISQWTDDGGAALRARFETVVDGAVSALLVQLGLAEEASGYYQLGILAMNRKKFDVADMLYQKALALAPGDLAVRNAMAVNLYHEDKPAEALAALGQLAEGAPDFGPAHYNLAWIHAEVGEDLAAAKASYDRAQALGMSTHKKIDKALGLDS